MICLKIIFLICSLMIDVSLSNDSDQSVQCDFSESSQFTDLVRLNMERVAANKSLKFLDFVQACGLKTANSLEFEVNDNHLPNVSCNAQHSFVIQE